jgi:hypothetical protein
MLHSSKMSDPKQMTVQTSTNIFSYFYTNFLVVPSLGKTVYVLGVGSICAMCLLQPY